MKQSHLLTISTLLGVLITFTACIKKDVPPELSILVKDRNEMPIEGAYVHAWPADPLPSTTSSGIPNELMDKDGLTNANGEILLGFPFSAVLNVDVEYFIDTSSIKLAGHKVVSIEVKRQKEDEDNIFYETIYIE